METFIPSNKLRALLSTTIEGRPLLITQELDQIRVISVQAKCLKIIRLNVIQCSFMLKMKTHFLFSLLADCVSETSKKFRQYGTGAVWGRRPAGWHHLYDGQRKGRSADCSDSPQGMYYHIYCTGYCELEPCSQPTSPPRRRSRGGPRSGFFSNQHGAARMRIRDRRLAKIAHSVAGCTKQVTVISALQILFQLTVKALSLFF